MFIFFIFQNLLLYIWNFYTINHDTFTSLFRPSPVVVLLHHTQFDILPVPSLSINISWLLIQIICKLLFSRSNESRQHRIYSILKHASFFKDFFFPFTFNYILFNHPLSPSLPLFSTFTNILVSSDHRK